MSKQIKITQVFTRVRTIWWLNSVVNRGVWTEEESVTGGERDEDTVTRDGKKGVHNNVESGERGQQSVPRVQMLFSRVRTLLDAHSSVRCFVMPLNTASLSSLLRIRNILSIQHRWHRTMASSPSLPGTDCGSADMSQEMREKNFRCKLGKWETSFKLHRKFSK